MPAVTLSPCPACGRPYNPARIPPPRVPLDTSCACCCPADECGNPAAGRVAEETDYLRTCWPNRNLPSHPAGRETYRHFIRRAVGELRYLTNRPRKRPAPTHYGHPSTL